MHKFQIRFKLFVTINAICIWGTVVNGQSSITGKLLDALDHKPVDFATVYINKQTIGTISDTEGNFTLENVQLPANIIISHLNYNVQNILVEEPNGKPLTILLDKKINEIEEVSIIGKNLWEKYIRIFKRQLLGTDEWGWEAKLLNPEVVQFRSGDPDSSKHFELHAWANAPLQISLPKLGYQLHFDLVEFFIGYDETIRRDILKYVGYYYYQPLIPKNRFEEYLIKKNRLQVYYNSSMHFLRSLYNNELKANGYILLTQNTDSVGFPIKTVLFNIQPYIRYNEKNEMLIEGLTDKKILVDYYQNGRSKPCDLNRYICNFLSESEMFIVNEQCTIRANGTIPGAYILFTGTFDEKHIGASLPGDYFPKNK